MKKPQYMYIDTSMQCTAISKTVKKQQFSDEKILHFAYFCSNIDCRYSLMSTYKQCLRAEKIKHTPVKQKFHYIICDIRKRFFAYAKTKTQISFAVTAKLISAFVFAT